MQSDSAIGRSMAVNDEWGIGALGVAIGAFIAGLWAWLTQKSKGGTDVEVAAIGEWQKLYKALSGRVSELELARARDREEHAREVAQLIKDHSDAMEALKANHREEMKELRNYCEGLERHIAQNSQSRAHLLSDQIKGKGKGNGN